MECDILTGERGSSYTSIDQIKMKLLHIRFHFNDQAADDDDKGRDEADQLFLSSSDRVTDHTLATKARNFREMQRSLNIDCQKRQ